MVARSKAVNGQLQQQQQQQMQRQRPTYCILLEVKSQSSCDNRHCSNSNSIAKPDSDSDCRHEMHSTKIKAERRLL